jgi:hypothetical protein
MANWPAAISRLRASGERMRDLPKSFVGSKSLSGGGI